MEGKGRSGEIARKIPEMGVGGGQTSGYMIRGEMQRELLKGVAGVRAWKYERRLEEGKGEYWQGSVGRK